MEYVAVRIWWRKFCLKGQTSQMIDMKNRCIFNTWQLIKRPHFVFWLMFLLLSATLLRKLLISSYQESLQMVHEALLHSRRRWAATNSLFTVLKKSKRLSKKKMSFMSLFLRPGKARRPLPRTCLPSFGKPSPRPRRFGALRRFFKPLCRSWRTERHGDMKGTSQLQVEQLPSTQNLQEQSRRKIIC